MQRLQLTPSSHIITAAAETEAAAAAAKPPSPVAAPAPTPALMPEPVRAGSTGWAWWRRNSEPSPAEVAAAKETAEATAAAEAMELLYVTQAAMSAYTDRENDHHHYQNIIYYKGQTRGDSAKKDRHGHGRAIYADGSVYTGTFKHSRRHGRGVMEYYDKTTYGGQWADDKRHGRGISKSADGVIVSDCEWENGIPSSL